MIARNSLQRVRNHRAPDLAAAFYDQATGEKDIVWLDCAEHIDLYDVEPYVTQAVEAIAAFLDKS